MEQGHWVIIIMRACRISQRVFFALGLQVLVCLLIQFTAATKELDDSSMPAMPFVLPNLQCNDVVFVKTMKCASSTFESILKHRRESCKQRREPFVYARAEGGLKGVERKYRSQAGKQKKDYLRLTMAREPLSRVISHFYQCRPSKFHKGGANAECKSLAQRGPKTFFSSSHKFANNLMTRFLGSGQILSYRQIVDQYDFIIVQDRMAESIAMMHFYGSLTARDTFVLSGKRRKKEYVEMSPQVLEIARQHNVKDFKLWQEVMARHNATLALFKGLDVVTKRWEEKLGEVESICREQSSRQDECLDEQCQKWDPCRLNDLAHGLEDAGLAKDLRGNSTWWERKRSRRGEGK